MDKQGYEQLDRIEAILEELRELLSEEESEDEPTEEDEPTKKTD